LEEKANLTEFRVILKREKPPTDINNVKGTLILQKDELFFRSIDIDENKNRKYTLKDFSKASIISFKEWFKKKEAVLIEFAKKDVCVEVYFEPIDISAGYLLESIQKYRKSVVKESNLSSTVGAFFEKLGTGSQIIAKEIGTIIQSSHDLTQVISQSIAFIREATKAANILDSIDVLEDKNSVDLIVKDKEIDIDDILKRSLASEKVEAMISGLIAKGLISARDQKFQEALDALKIAREAAEKENLKEYTEAVDENIESIRKMDSDDDISSELSEKAVKYATEARKIVTEWEASKNNEVQDDSSI
jgi:rRNA-processing protein FCF1